MVSFQHHCNFIILVGICLVGTFVPSNLGLAFFCGINKMIRTRWYILKCAHLPIEGIYFGVTVDGSEIRLTS